MEILKSILTDLEDKKITKEKAYNLIVVLIDGKGENKTSHKSNKDFREHNRESQQEYFGTS